MFRDNDTDSQMGSDESIADSLDRVRVDEWRRATGRKPTGSVPKPSRTQRDRVQW